VSIQRLDNGMSRGVFRAARRRTPRGMTILEVLIALAIFLASAAAIAQLIGTGSQASTEARLEADAVLRAETVMNEIMGGVHLMQSIQGQSFEDDPAWQWSLTVGDGPHVDLLRLDVTVTRQEPAGEPQISYTLSRLTRNPELFLDSSLSAE
jgi:type II secretion system protein I